ncbi:MAG: PP2C family protein-serine/threonine phosphatase [Bacteroidota bacterium]
MPATYRHLLLGLVAVAGYVVWVLMYSGFSQADAVATEIDRTEARRLAEQVAAEQNVPLDGFDIVNITLRVSNFQLTYYQAYAVPPEEQAQVTAFRTPGFWDIVYASEALGTITARIGTTGEVYNWFTDFETPPDSGRISLADAQAIADQALGDRLGVDPYDYTLVDAQTLEGDTRTSYAFQWRHRADSSDALLRREVRVDVGPSGVEGWGRIVDLPDAHQTAYRAYSDRANTYNLGRSGFIFLIWVLSLTVFLMRFREYEISLRNAFVYTTLFTVAYVLYMWNALPFTTSGAFDSDNWSRMRTQTMLGLAIGVFFTTLGVFQAWVSGETLLRERWPNKLNVLDGLFAGRARFKGLGESILVGFLYAGLQLGLIALLFFGIIEVGKPWQIVSNNDQFLLSSSSVLSQLPLNTLVSVFLSGAYMLAFTMGFTRLRLPTWAAILVTATVFGAFFSDHLTVYDFTYSALVMVCSVVVALVCFVRHDWVAAIVATVLPDAFAKIMLFLSQPAPAFQWSGWLTIGVMLVLLACGVVLYLRAPALSAESVTPSYARYITERERLKMELDIARRSQLQMLPRHVPEATGLDIAAFSEPAREVGGDYYDFMELGPKTLGIAVGDVSGKGMPAALYMTMLKGFLQSKADPQSTPVEVLAHVNRKFYQSAERSMYVTLIYALIDLAKAELRFARAGHLPLIVFRPVDQTSYVLQPPGLGIGLESGVNFQRLMREEVFALRSGDVVAFFTDGLTEARSRSGEEFGQERLLHLIKQHHALSAEGVLQQIRIAVRRFEGTTEPHDDLTGLIVKVT